MTQTKQLNLTDYLSQVSMVDTDTLQQLLTSLRRELNNRSDSDYIYISWCVADIRDIRPDLTADQCGDVLRHLCRNHDVEIGINWEVIEDVAGDLYPYELNNDRAGRIAELNDLCRKAMGVGGKLIQTEGINMLSPEEQSAIREKVENFNDFPEDNDPYRERDFGAFDHNSKRVFWKIDYYAPDLMHGSEDPADPSQTVRVLTIMLAEEY